MRDADAVDVLRDAIEEAGGLTQACAASAGIRALMRGAWAQGWAWELVCDAKQAGWIRRFLAGRGSYVWRHGRQRGKSFGAVALADIVCRSLPGTRVRYCALTIETARAIIGAAMGDFYASCPEDLRPRQEGDDYVFPNGSRLIVMGTDAQTFRRGRGFSRISLDLRDECGFYQDFDAVDRALNPGLQVPGPSGEPGRVLYLSTPAESPAHPYTRVARVHRARGAFELETFRDNPRVDPEAIIRAEMERTGYSREELLASTAFRREYLSEDVVEETRAAVPAWTAEAAAVLTSALPRPPFYDGYGSLDLGYSPDPSAALLGWHDVAGNRLVIEYELELRGGTVADLAKGLKDLEKVAWGVDKYDGTLLALAEEVAELPEFLRRKVHRDAPRQPFLRVGDDDALVLAELAGTHGLAVMPTRKDDKALAVDFVNQLVAARRLYVHPRCVRLLEQLGSTIWNKARTGWERTGRDHGDLIDALVYLARNIRWHRDCRPPAPVTTFHSSPTKPKERDWAKAFARRR